MFDKREDGEILLESMTCDLRRFVMRQPLPAVYRYCRLATRKELVDYMTDIAFASVGV